MRDEIVNDYKKRSKSEADNILIKRVFTKYKVITYFFVIVLPPIALYRLLNNKSMFEREEKIIYSFICISFLCVYFKSFM